MVVGRRDTMGLYPTLNINNRHFKRTKKFKYLGSILSERNEIKIEIGVRIKSVAKRSAQTEFKISKLGGP
jgi:hypothetical protein